MSGLTQIATASPQEPMKKRLTRRHTLCARCTSTSRRTDAPICTEMKGLYPWYQFHRNCKARSFGCSVASVCFATQRLISSESNKSHIRQVRGAGSKIIQKYINDLPTRPYFHCQYWASWYWAQSIGASSSTPAIHFGVIAYLYFKEIEVYEIDPAKYHHQLRETL